MRQRGKIIGVSAGVVVAVLAVGAVLYLCSLRAPKPGTVPDEAKRAGLTAKDMPGSTDPYLHEMDRGWNEDQVYQALADALGMTQKELEQASHLKKDAVWKAYNKGRNNWVVWSGGNDRFWDFMANNTVGAFDLLKILSSHPSIAYCGNTKGIRKVSYGEGYGASQSYGDADSGAYRPMQYPRGYYVYEDDGCTKSGRELFPASRSNRWKYYGLLNEPGFEEWAPPARCRTADGADKKPEDPKDKSQWCGNPDRWGLWLDRRTAPSDPFENEKDYPGVKIGARGQRDIHGGTFPVGSYYGYASGIVGLRLFPNPDFDEKAQAKWDPWRYYNDPDYYNDKDLVRPYRVGMSCGFCHVGPSPVNPPKDPENPAWSNLTSNPGAQYFWVDRIFVWNPKKRHENFIYQLFHTSLPGSLDTSFVSNDNINNPRTMNAVYSVAARLGMATREKLAGGSLNNEQFNDHDETKFLSAFFDPPDVVVAPHVLKDGADSVGVLGALNRVYLNIGLASEEWLLHFKPLIGNVPFKRITPIEISVLEKTSTYWNANLTQTPSLALFFLASAQPDRLTDLAAGKYPFSDPGAMADAKEALQDAEAAALKNAPGFGTYDALLNHGKIVFAENCARCHSGKQPPMPKVPVAPENRTQLKGTLCRLGTECVDGQIVENSAAYFDWMRHEVQKDDFLEHNFLSTERRIPVTELGTNACSPLATNGLGGDIWDNFTSQTYKELPAVGKITVRQPLSGQPYEYEMPGGGRGYTRPASLISLWSTAPFLLNNSVGRFYGEPSIAARIASFDDSIAKMLWPDRRDKDPFIGSRIYGPSRILRTTTPSYLRVPGGYLPDSLRVLLDIKNRWFSWIYGDGELCIGPIPEGTPVNLIGNIPLVAESADPRERGAHAAKLAGFLKTALADLKEVDRKRAARGGKVCEDLTHIDKAMNQELKDIFANLVPGMLELSKCPDFIVNRGHYFGTNLGDDDKYALIEFLRTF